MDEEQMWKGFFEKLQDIKSNPTTEHESIIQNSDGGFFEKFGYLLRQKSKIEESESKPALAPFSIEESSKESIDLGKTHPEEEEGSSQEFKKDEFITVENNVLSDHFIQGIVGMNVEDLYEEILFEILNNVGYNSTEVTSDGLIEFAQDVFKIPIKKHVEILKYAQAKEPPKLRLNIEVIKAENLVPKDSNGLSDPFVTLYLESHSSHRYNSSVKPRTLDPVWEEHFSLPIAENLKNEVLIIEVWDFDAAETVKEKVNKILDVRGVKGLRKLMKEIAVTASTGKHDNELIGKSAIILKAIPTSGFTGWYNLEKKTKTKSRGSLLVSLTLSAEKNKNVAIQEHRHLLQLLLMYELESSQVRNFWWSGKFSANGEALRSQHAVQSGLSTYECALSQWIAYSIIHESHHLSFNLFNSILDVLLPNLKYQNSEDVKNFWDAAKRLLPSCFSVIRKIRSKNTSDKTILKIIVEVLDILSKIKSMQIPETCNLFPSSVYGWIDTTSSHCSINDIVKAAIIATTKEWMEYIIEGSKSGKKIQTDEEQLQYLIKIVQMVRADLQKASEYFDKHFNKKIQLNYSEILFCYYDMKLCEISKPIVIKVCSNIKRLQVPDDQFEYLPNIDDINMGTTLFELYLILKRFLEFGTNLCSTDVVLEMEFYYHWFMPGVTHWLDISIIKALNRIQKAIELDKLKPVDETVKFSSSAVDTLAIFYQIKIFWEQLAWPDIEGSYTFVAKIIDDVCRCCVFYAQTISRRLENLEIDDRNSFIVSSEWCLAINNIDYIRQSLPSFIKELNVDEIIRKLGEYRSNLEADRCAVTVKNVIDNALDTERNQILELLEIITKKMAPSMQRFLTEGAEVLHENSNSMEKLMAYLEKSLAILYEFLNEINFGRILDAIWAELSVVLYDLIKSSLDKRRPPAFFQNLRKTLNIMISSFKIGSIVSSDIEVLSEIERILELHALETADLIHQYYLDRYKNTCDTSEFGQLTITADFTQDVLILKILNARNLLPMDTNGSCDSFVKIHLLPSSRFPGQGPFKTSTRLKTRFPLFDETFSIPITEEQRSDGSNLLLFSIKDKDLFGMTNQYIAECYVTFQKLLSTGNIQIHLTLSRPEYADSDIIRALEHRQGDKQAKEFIKKLKNKSS